MTTSADANGNALTLAGRIRIAVRVSAMLALLAVCVPLHLVWAPFTEHNPWPRRFLHALARALGVRIRIAGRLPPPGTLLLPNHVSWLDIAVLGGVTGTAFVAHDGLAEHPVLRRVAALNDTVFIARERRTTVARQVEQVREAVRETGALTIFPEGTTGSGDALLPFKSALLSPVAAFPAGIAVHPVWIDYGAATAEIAWLDESGLANFVKVAARSQPIEATLHILPALTGEALADRKATAAAAQRAIEAVVATGSSEAGDQRVAL